MATHSLTQTILLEELAARKGRDARYSLRSFARDLGVSKTALSDVIGGRRRFSRSSALRVIERLELAPARRLGFLEEHVLKTGSLAASSAQRGEDEYRAASDLHSLALVALSRLKASRAEPEWIARKLGISIIEARAALDRLVRLGRVEIREGALRLPASLPQGAEFAAETPQSRRGRAKQVLRAAESAIERFPGIESCFQSQAIAVPPERMKEAENLIAEFRASFARRMGEPPVKAERGEVCLLSVQFFPMSRPAFYRGDES